MEIAPVEGRSEEDAIESIILSGRSRRIILDADLARIYGVTTKALNQAAKRNRDRFPEDFAFRLSADELSLRRRALRAQPLDQTQKLANRSQIVTGFAKHRDPRSRPLPLVQPAPDPPKRRIGFHIDGE